MAEMIFRIPSKAVQYGYVEMPVGMQDGASPELVAAAYVNYVYAFQKEEQATLQRLADGLAGVDPRDSIGDPQQAAVAAIKEGLGATEVDESGAPWTKKVDAPKKPWETGPEADQPSPPTRDVSKPTVSADW
jgi:hypothetical protein